MKPHASPSRWDDGVGTTRCPGEHLDCAVFLNPSLVPLAVFSSCDDSAIRRLSQPMGSAALSAASPALSTAPASSPRDESVSLDVREPDDHLSFLQDVDMLLEGLGLEASGSSLAARYAARRSQYFSHSHAEVSRHHLHHHPARPQTSSSKSHAHSRGTTGAPLPQLATSKVSSDQMLFEQRSLILRKIMRDTMSTVNQMRRRGTNSFARSDQRGGKLPKSTGAPTWSSASSVSSLVIAPFVGAYTFPQPYTSPFAVDRPLPSPVLRWGLLSLFPLINSVGRLDPLLKQHSIRILIDVLRTAPPLSLADESESALEQLLQLIQPGADTTVRSDDGRLPHSSSVPSHSEGSDGGTANARATALLGNSSSGANLPVQGVDPLSMEVTSALVGVSLHRGSLRHILSVLEPLLNVPSESAVATEMRGKLDIDVYYFQLLAHRRKVGRRRRVLFFCLLLLRLLIS